MYVGGYSSARTGNSHKREYIHIDEKRTFALAKMDTQINHDKLKIHTVFGHFQVSGLSISSKWLRNKKDHRFTLETTTSLFFSRALA